MRIYGSTQSLPDLRSAVFTTRLAADFAAIDAGSSDAEILSYLGTWIHTRFESNKSLEDLHSAIHALRCAVKLAVDGRRQEEEGSHDHTDLIGAEDNQPSSSMRRQLIEGSSSCAI